jgi:serine/threonine protein kinase
MHVLHTELGFVHGDIKPSNVLLHPKHDFITDPTPLLFDFDLSTRLKDEPNERDRQALVREDVIAVCDMLDNDEDIGCIATWLEDESNKTALTAFTSALRNEPHATTSKALALLDQRVTAAVVTSAPSTRSSSLSSSSSSSSSCSGLVD